MQPDESNLDLIIRALKFAAAKHQHQRRKDPAASPYINHPITVMETLWTVGQIRDAQILAAALLHDTLEDTETTPQELEASFGPQVLALVQEVSDDKQLPQAVRKQLQIDHAKELTREARLIKLGDKISNVHDVGYAPPPHWTLQRCREYLDWSERVVARLRGTHTALEQEYDRVLAEARRQLAARDSA